MTSDTSTEQYLDDPEHDDEAAAPFVTPSNLKAPQKTLARHLLEAVMTRAQMRRFLHSPGLCVLIEAPTPAWVEPLRSAAAAMAVWHHAEARDGTARLARKTTEGEEQIARCLGAGQRIVAVSHAPERHLPPSLVAGADMRIRTGHPTPDVIRKAIRDATGVKPRAASQKLGGRLDYFDLVSAIRVGSDVRTCLKRLDSATVNRTVVDQFPANIPDLAALHGYGEAHIWAMQLVEDVEAWRRGEISDFSALDRQVVFSGPPGTGKSTLVASIAKAAKLPIITTSVARWFIDGNAHIDGTLKQAEAVFSHASSISPAILFLDEIDAIPNRANLNSRNADYWAPIVGYILQFLDGISTAGPSSSNLIIIGATNFGDALDPALVRPGRLSKVIKILPPDEKAIPGIVRQHLGKDLVGVDLGDIGSMAAGATGAVIAGWVKGARRRARVAKRAMVLDDLMAEVLAPENRSPGAIWRCAVHESSHALVAHVTRPNCVQSVSIQASGNRGGRVVTLSSPGEVTQTRADIEAVIVTALAGRAGEIVFGLEASTGAYNDLTVATDLAASIHVSFGMGEGLAQRRPAGHAASLMDDDPVIRRRVGMTLEESNARAIEIVIAYRELIETVANVLVADTRIDAAGFLRLVEDFERNRAPTDDRQHGIRRHG